jgi:antitoxin ParD1/3/4
MLMEVLNIALDDDTRAFVDGQAAEHGCESAEAYIAGLVAADYRRWARERLEKLLLEGIESGPATPMTRGDWDDLRQRVHQHLQREATPEGEAKAPAGSRA